MATEDGDVWQYEDAANFMSDPRQNARAHHPLPPAEVGAEGRYLGRCSCGWRGQIPHSYESGANADTTAHIQEIRHGQPAHQPHRQGR